MTIPGQGHKAIRQDLKHYGINCFHRDSFKLILLHFTVNKKAH